MIRSASPAGYSSDVRIELRVGDRVFNVSQVCDKVCLVRNPDDVPAGPAELMISVDGQQKLKTVTLRDGIKAGSREVNFV